MERKIDVELPEDIMYNCKVLKINNSLNVPLTPLMHLYRLNTDRLVS